MRIIPYDWWDNMQTPEGPTLVSERCMEKHRLFVVTMIPYQIGDAPFDSSIERYIVQG